MEEHELASFLERSPLALEIMSLLLSESEPQSPAAIAAALRKKPPNIARSIKVLISQGLVELKKVGRFSYYSLPASHKSMLQKVLGKLRDVEPARFPRVALSSLEDTLEETLVQQLPVKVATGIQYGIKPYPDLVVNYKGRRFALEFKLSTSFERRPYEILGMIAALMNPLGDRRIDNVILVLIGPVKKEMKDMPERIFGNRNFSVINVTEGVEFKAKGIERLDEERIVAEIMTKLRQILR